MIVAIEIRMLLASRYQGFISDQGLFIHWMETIRQYGLGEAYIQNGSINYPPLFLMLMDGYGKVLSLFGTSALIGTLSFKGIVVLVDFAAMLAAIKLSAGIRSSGWRLFILALFALNPVLIAGGAVWGQIDMLHSLLMVLAIVSLTKKTWLSGVWAALALLTKFQAVTILPIIGIYLLIEAFRNRRWKPSIGWLGGFAVPWLVTVGYFASAGGLKEMIKLAYTDAVGMYTSATVNAANIWFHVVGIDPSSDDTTPFLLGMSLRTFSLLLFAAAALFICVYEWIATRSGDIEAVLLKASCAMGFAFFMLPTEIHERYGIPALVFALFVVLHDRRWLVAAVGMSVTMLVNILVVMQDAASGRFGGRGNGDGLGRRGFGSGRGFENGGGLGNGRGPGSGSDFGADTPFGSGRSPIGGGPGTTMAASYTWIAVVNVLLLIWLLWVMWYEMRQVRQVRQLKELADQEMGQPRQVGQR
ncbi:hypothetical protein D3H35_00710 [Cohnella faecalis]|uniref:DUF2029 domain-containing protein n=1 Tax=Cohnella faecalis TaxID=2315694 RepID=A0A398CRX1_9BACL|nr:hypothetical protein D3H35_00710 [Cohnella faecalis]